MGEENKFGKFYIVGDDGEYKELSKIKDAEIETTGSEDLYPDLKVLESSEFSCDICKFNPFELYILMFGKVKGVILYIYDAIKRRFRK